MVAEVLGEDINTLSIYISVSFSGGGSRRRGYEHHVLQYFATWETIFQTLSEENYMHSLFSVEPTCISFY